MSHAADVHPVLYPDHASLFKLLENKFVEHCELIKNWFLAEWEKTPAPVYGSMDLRNAGFKLAPIDMNLFPAGFNNLNPDFLAFASTSAEKTIIKRVPDARYILIIAENHTRNLFYWESMFILTHILEIAGFTVKVTKLDATEEMTIETAKKNSVTVSPLERTDNKLHIGGFKPDFILLNNDLSDGIPGILQQLDQPLFPPAELGWSERLKSNHFEHYANVTSEFAKLIDIDEWLITPLFRHCGEVNFMESTGIECVAHHAEKLFAAIEKKYADYDVKQPPFLVVKSDSGTYGHAVMTIKSVDELRNMNRKQRTKMAVSKGKQPVNRVIIQEGVYTFETCENGAVAEPVTYLFGECVIGGFYRVHKERGVDESLNAPGMHFASLPFSMSCDEPCRKSSPQPMRNKFFTYGVIAKLSMLAAAREIHQQKRGEV